MPKNFLKLGRNLVDNIIAGVDFRDFRCRMGELSDFQFLSRKGCVMSNEIMNKVRDSFNFKVQKFPLSGPDNMATPWYGLFRDDTQEVVGTGSVTSRYVPHQTDDVIALCEAASTAFDGVADVNCGFRDGHYVSIVPSKDYRRSIYGTADNVFPRVIINAGYDGKAFSATMGYYRDLCKNLAIMRTVKSTVVSIRHTAGLLPKMRELIDTFGVLKESWADLGKVIDHLESRQVSMVDFLDKVYGKPEEDSKRGLTMHKNRTELIFNRLASERLRSNRPELGRDFMVSAWEAFNAVQGYVQHDSRRHGGNHDDFSRAIMASRDLNVQRAESAIMELVAA